MSRPYKIKRTKYTGPIKSRRHPVIIALMLLAVIGLGYLGFVSYDPIYNAIMNGEKPMPEPSVPMEAPKVSKPEADSSTSAPTAPEPAVTAKLQGVYLPSDLISNSAALDAFLQRVSDSSCNAVMVDIKDKNGQVLFASQNKQALKWQAIAPGALDLDAFARRLEEQGLFLIVRMSAFRDETAARGNKDYAVHYRAPGTLWLDNFQNQGGKPWLNPYSAGAKQYLLDLALEAAGCGAALVVLDDFCFPPNSLTGDAYFGDAQEPSRSETLAGFAREMEEALEAKNARGAIYLTGTALAGGPDPTVYGGAAADLFDRVLLGTLPYQFYDGYSTAKLSLRRPLEDPADTVNQVVAMAQKELGDREVIPLIQGGPEPSEAVYTSEQIAAQVKSLKDLGLEEYIWYCTDYTAYLLPS